MLLRAPFDDLSIGKRKSRVSKSDGQRLISSTRKIKSAVGGLTSMGAKGSYVNNVGIEHRQAVVKARIVKHGKSWDEIRTKHLNYIQRDGVAEDGGKGLLFSSSSEDCDGSKYLADSRNDKHEFRFIIAPEAASNIDLEYLTRKVLKQMEIDLKTKLNWVASDHYNTDKPHVHVVMRGIADDGSTLNISKDYISNGIRIRTREILTREIGLRSRQEIELVYKNEITANRFTSIDRFIKKQLGINSTIINSKILENANAYIHRDVVKNRLEYLKNIGLFHQEINIFGRTNWKAEDNWEKVLRDKGMSNDIIKIMHREAKLDVSSCEVFNRDTGKKLKGHIVWRGIHEEITDKQFIVVRDSKDKNYYVALDKFSLPASAKVGDVVTVNTSKTEDFLRKSDEVIERFARANNDYYDPEKYREHIKAKEPTLGKNKVEEYIKWNQKRLEQLSKIGVIDAANDKGHWKIKKTFIADIYEMAKEKGQCKYLRIKCERPLAVDIKRKPVKGMGL